MCHEQRSEWYLYKGVHFISQDCPSSQIGIIILMALVTQGFLCFPSTGQKTQQIFLYASLVLHRGLVAHHVHPGSQVTSSAILIKKECWKDFYMDESKEYFSCHWGLIRKWHKPHKTPVTVPENIPKKWLIGRCLLQYIYNCKVTQGLLHLKVMF